MKTISINIALLLVLFLASGKLNAQSKTEGDDLIAALNNKEEAEPVKKLLKDYNFEEGNEEHYLSKDGLELIFEKGRLNQISLYKGSLVYGNYTGKLPKGLKFGMSPAEAKATVGKTSLAYNTGYCEFSFPDCVISCWFEGGALNQVNIGAK